MCRARPAAYCQLFFCPARPSGWLIDRRVPEDPRRAVPCHFVVPFVGSGVAEGCPLDLFYLATSRISVDFGVSAPTGWPTARGVGFVLDIRAPFFRLCLCNRVAAHRVGWEGVVMEYVLVAGTALVLGFRLGVLVVRRLGASGPDESPGRVPGHARTVSAWWR